MKHQCAGAGHTIEAQLELENWLELEREPGTSPGAELHLVIWPAASGVPQRLRKKSIFKWATAKGVCDIPKTRTYSSDCECRVSGEECSSRGWTVLKFK